MELLDLTRNQIKNHLGDVAIEDAWKIEWLNAFQVVVKPGIAWYSGLPFELRGSSDQLVSGTILTSGITPVGTTMEDHTTGLGKVITFNDGAVTPTNTYRIVITAKEELITDVEDPFLKNANITESTAQKVRLNYQINVVPMSLQTNASVPYTDESSSSVTPTNFPGVGNSSAPNLSNSVVVTPTASGNGELLSTTAISGSEAIDGRDLELTIRNDPNVGLGIVLPNGSTAQQVFQNGKLVDSNGNMYHLNLIVNGVVSTQLVLRIDKEPGQPDPVITNGSPYTLYKRDVYVTDDVNGSPQGKLYWAVADMVYNQTSGITHSTKIVDLRKSVQKREDLETNVNTKINLIPTSAGDISFASNTLTWASDIILYNAFGENQEIPNSNVDLLEGSALVYELDLDNGGDISRGNLAINITSNTLTVSSLSAVDLSMVRIGNIVTSGAEIRYITAIDDVNNTITVDTAFTVTGAATIYMDTFASETAILTKNSYVLATMMNGKVQFANGVLELENGETNQIGDGVSQELLAYIGATSESDSAPAYTNNYAVTDGNSLTQSVSDNSAVVETTDQYVGKPSNLDNTPTYSSNIRGIANENLTNRIGTNTDSIGDYQEDRSGYLRSNNSITWSGTQLSFTSDIILELINTKSGTLTQHIVLAASSPISLSDGESAYVNINRTSASENLTIILSGTTPIPAQTQTNKDIFVLFRRSGSNLLIPFHKELIPSGETIVIGNNTTGANRTLSNLDSPTSINQNLLPDATANNRALGNSANRWAGTTSTVVATSEIREITGTFPTIKNDSRRLTNSSSVDVLDWSGTNLDVLTRKIVNVVDPTAAQDAATKNYVDSNSGGFDTITITVNTSLVARKTYLTNSTGGALVLTLPAPVLNTFVRVKDKLGTSSTNSITVNPNGAETIDGASSYVITSDFEAKLFVSDGTNWFIL